MEKAIWKGNEIVAIDVAQAYELEKAIKQASGRKELLCPDEQCEHRTLKYCHGEKKQAYFAHLINSNCSYEKYDKETPEITKEIKRALYQHLVALGFKVTMDCKLIEGHYTHIVVNENGQQYAVQVLTRFDSANRIEDFRKKYAAKNIRVNWIVVDIRPSESEQVDEKSMFFAKRFCLNETSDNSLITTDATFDNVVCYRMDKNEYKLDSRTIESKNYPKVFRKSYPSSLLSFQNGKLVVPDFDDAFTRYISKKSKAFEKLKAKATEAKQKWEEELARRRKQLADEEADRKRKAQEAAENAKKEKERLDKEKANRIKERAKPKELSEETVLDILSQMDLAPFYHNYPDQMLPWTEQKFEEYLDKIRFSPDANYKFILSKIRYGSTQERNLFIQLYNQRGERSNIERVVLEMLYEQISKDGLI